MQFFSASITMKRECYGRHLVGTFGLVKAFCFAFVCAENRKGVLDEFNLEQDSLLGYLVLYFVG